MDMASDQSIAITNPKKDITKKKKHGPFHMFRIAFFMLRPRSNKKLSTSIHVEVASKNLWRQVLHVLRPLNQPGELKRLTETTNVGPNEDVIDGLPSPTSVLEAPESPASTSSGITSQYVLETPGSPASTSSGITSQYVLEAPGSPASTSSGITSKYASALNLQELHETDDDELEVEDGDIMIDARAEEFITSFYEQMNHEKYRGNRPGRANN